MQGFRNSDDHEQATVRFASLDYADEVSVDFGHLRKFFLRDFAAEAYFSDLLTEHSEGGMSHPCTIKSATVFVYPINRSTLYCVR